MVILKTYDASQLTHLDKAKLADEGIESYVEDENIVSTMPYLSAAFGAIKLLVAENDVQRAREILKINEFGTLTNVYEGELDPQPSCPQCHSIEIVQRKSIIAGIIYLILFFVPIAAPIKRWYCTNCGFTWKMT